jgi:hypothetical protein
MKTPGTAAVTARAGQRTPHPSAPAPRPRRGRPDGVKAGSRAQQKDGAYKRVEIFLGLEAAIALRRLMRDGRTAREVIEALLLDARRPAAASAPTHDRRQP